MNSENNYISDENKRSNQIKYFCDITFNYRSKRLVKNEQINLRHNCNKSPNPKKKPKNN